MEPSQIQSAYRSICQALTQTPGTPYIFQDVRDAGIHDVSFVLRAEPLQAHDQSKYAKAMSDELLLCVQAKIISEKLRSLIAFPPMFMYSEKFSLRTKILLEESKFQPDELFQFGMMLATDRQAIGEVKLGIYILGLFKNDISAAVIRTLGLHSEFTFASLEAMYSWPKYNDIVFDFAQNTTGYGRLMSVHRLIPITTLQQEWLFINAMKTTIERNLIAQRIMSLPDIEEHLDSLTIDEVEYHALSRLFAYAFHEKNAKDYQVSKSLISKYLDRTAQFSNSFIDQAAIVMIRRSMLPSWQQAGVDVPKQNGWSSDIEYSVLEKCKTLWHKPEYRLTLLLREMNHPQEDHAIIVKVLETYAFDYSFPLPDFLAFSQMLTVDPFDMDIARFMLIEHPEKYAKSIAERILNVIPEDVLSSPAIIEPAELSQENRPDIWLIYLLSSRKKVDFECEQICLRCLHARFQDVRIHAITVLRFIKLKWSHLVIPALEKAMLSEPDEKIIKRIKRLLGISLDQKKEHRYVDISDETITPTPYDRIFLETEIAGTFFRDMDAVIDVLDAGDILYLKREPENKYDSNAILVTAEDGYVLGYVPRTQNQSLVSLMDAGERLYAILRLAPKAYDGKPPISIVISQTAPETGKVLAFPSGKELH
ncbi:MAG TPA: HIRAN domain-containing protein [Clostridia bacterium]|nr:HIRAN domain-containing protein [Clostridia bacterium]